MKTDDTMAKEGKESSNLEAPTRKMWLCPRCKLKVSDYPAISRRDNKTKICSACGADEAMFDFKIFNIKKAGLWTNPEIDMIKEGERKWLK